VTPTPRLTRRRRLAIRRRAAVVRSTSNHLLQRQIAGVCIAALSAGCASVATSRTGDVPVAGRPGLVMVLLTPSVQWAPRAPEEMLEPAVEAAVAACERSRGTRCGERATPGEARARFSRDENERVHVFVVLGDIEAGASYEIRVRWLGPDGGVAARMAMRLRTPEPTLHAATLTADFWLDAKTMRPGRWRAEVAVNGEVEAERTFEVIGLARSLRARARAVAPPFLQPPRIALDHAVAPPYTLPIVRDRASARSESSR
jgi:hypothetical protein